MKKRKLGVFMKESQMQNTIVLDENIKEEVHINDWIKKRKINWLLDRKFFASNENTSIVEHSKAEFFNYLNMKSYEEINIMFQNEKQIETATGALINRLSLQDKEVKLYVEAEAKREIALFSTTHLKVIKALINVDQFDESNVTAEYHTKVLELTKRGLYEKAWREYQNIYSLASKGHLFYLHIIIDVTKITLEIIDLVSGFIYPTSKHLLLADREFVLKNLRTIKNTLVDNKINCSGGFIQILHTEDHVCDLRKAFCDFKKEFALTPNTGELRKFIMNRKATDDSAYEYILSICPEKDFVVLDKGYRKKTLSYKRYLNLVSEIANSYT